MRNRIFFLLSFMLCLMLILSGCSGSSKKDDSWEYIESKGEFVIGLDDAFPPMGFKDENGEIVGFDIDLAKAVAEKMGVKVKFQPVAWDGVIMELNNKNIDVIWNGFTITEKRKKSVAFTKPYLENRQIIIVKKGSPIKSKADLAGKRVGLQAGSSSFNALEKDEETYKKVEDRLVEFSTNDEVLLDLKNGGIDAAVMDEIVARYYMAKKPDEFEILRENFGSEEYGIGVRKGDTRFLEKLQTALDETIKDGTAEEISKKWFGENIVK